MSYLTSRFQVGDGRLEPGDEGVQLIDHRPNRLRLAQVDAGALQQRHRMVAAAGLEQRQIAIDRGRLLRAEAPVSCFISCALEAKQVAY